MPELEEAIKGVERLSHARSVYGTVADQYMNPYLDTVLDRQKTAAIRDFNRTGAARKRRCKTRGIWWFKDSRCTTI